MRCMTMACKGFSGRCGVSLSLIMIGTLAVLPCLILSGCAGKTEIKIEKEFVSVPAIVATGCVATAGRPDRVKPLKETVRRDQWDVLAPGAKAQAVSAQAGTRMNYEDEDRAATSGCK